MHLRRSLEAANGLFVAEGEKVIRQAISSGYQVRSLLVTTQQLACLADLTDYLPGTGVCRLRAGGRGPDRLQGAPGGAGVDAAPRSYRRPSEVCAAPAG